MARTYYITAPPAVAGSHIRYTAHEVRCIVALFSLRLQSRGLRRWLRLRWWLLVSSERVIRHVRTCTYHQYYASQRRRERKSICMQHTIQPGFTEPTLALLAWR